MGINKISFIDNIRNQLATLKQSGLFKVELPLRGQQNSEVATPNGRMLNLCANNYLGLASHPEVQQAVLEGLKNWGYGLASVRFICGTQEQHLTLEKNIADFLHMPAAVVYPSCFDANAGLFETLLDANDAIISDQLNHASIIDGVRLCKAKRYRYANNNMEQLEQQLQQADKDGARYKIITTDGVFSMDGVIAQLDTICSLAKRYQALVHVDDCHATGVIGENGRGTHEYRQCMGQVDIITSTLGKALGGASGGFTAAAPDIVEWLRQQSRPYLFSNSMAPSLVAGALRALDIAKQPALRQTLHRNSKLFRQAMKDEGFDMIEGEHPIIPVMFYDEQLASQFAAQLKQQGLYLAAFTYPVVPKGKARIRVQISAAHTEKQLLWAVQQFCQVRANLAQ